MSLGEIRAVLAQVCGHAADARGHVLQAVSLLDEAAALLAELVQRTDQELPAEVLAKARDDVAEVAFRVAAGAEVVAELGARL